MTDESTGSGFGASVGAGVAKALEPGIDRSSSLKSCSLMYGGRCSQIDRPTPRSGRGAVARPDGDMARSQRLVGATNHVGHPSQIRRLAGRPAVEQTINRDFIEEEADEVARRHASTKAMDRSAVFIIADDPQVRERERRIRY
ncbi:MAG: hypothetical protein R2690_06805 [Acidimicrobiales bacterium]